MNIAQKEFRDYWRVMKIPFMILALFSIAGLVYAYIDYKAYIGLFGGWTGYIISILVFGYLGWSSVKDYKFSVRQAAWSGAILGVIAGLFGAVLSVIMMFTVPGLLDFTVRQAIASGASAAQTDMIKTTVKIVTFAGLILGPLINALIGAAISSLGGFIGAKTCSGKK